MAKTSRKAWGDLKRFVQVDLADQADFAERLRHLFEQHGVPRATLRGLGLKGIAELVGIPNGECKPGLSLDRIESAARVWLANRAITEGRPGDGDQTPAVDGPRPPAPKPSPKAIQAFWLQQAGYSQSRIAEFLKITQGNVSKLLRKVKAWTAAGNAVPQIEERERLRSKPMAMDPSTLDLGGRTDHRAAHQAAKLAETSGRGRE